MVSKSKCALFSGFSSAAAVAAIVALASFDPRRTNYWRWHAEWPYKQNALYHPFFQAFYYRIVGSNTAIAVSPVGFVDKGVGELSTMAFFVDVGNTVITFRYPIDQFVINESYPALTNNAENCYSTFEFRVGRSIFRDDYIRIDASGEDIADFMQLGLTNVARVEAEIRVPPHKGETLRVLCEHTLWDLSSLAGPINHLPIFDFYGDVVVTDAPSAGFVEVSYKDGSKDRHAFGAEYNSRFYLERYFGSGFPDYWLYSNSQHLVLSAKAFEERNAGESIRKHYQRGALLFSGFGFTAPLLALKVNMFILDLNWEGRQWRFETVRGDTISYERIARGKENGLPVHISATVHSWGGVKVHLSEVLHSKGNVFPFFTHQGTMVAGNSHAAPRNGSASHVNVTITRNEQVVLSITALKPSLECHGPVEKLASGFWA